VTGAGSKKRSDKADIMSKKKIDRNCVSGRGLEATALRTSRTMWMLFGLPFPAIAAMAAIGAIFLNSGLWFPAVILSLFSSVHLSWLGTTTLIRTQDAIHYRALLVRKDVPLSEVVRAKFEFGPKPIGPMQRIVIETRNQQRPRTITINAGLFDMSQSRQWVAALNNVVPPHLGHGTSHRGSGRESSI
jgi:hypothetical protein